MSEGLITLGPVNFTREGTRERFMEIISRLNLEPPVIIKPNWSSSIVFTESEILDWTLSSIDGEVLIVESYAAWRTKLLIEYNGPRDYAFLQLLGKQKREDHRENDKWFLEFSGIDRVLEKHGVEYLNLSEELWAKRVCEKDTIAPLVKRHTGALMNTSLYEIVPERLFELKGGTLLNLAKPKRSLKANHVSLAMKNMFGMIPSPWRGKYHGKDDSLLDQNIVDITKLYGALFDVKGIIEAVLSTSETKDDMLFPVIHRDLGLIWGSTDIMELDALVCSQLGLNPSDVSYLKLAAEKIKPWSDEIVELGSANPIDLP